MTWYLVYGNGGPLDAYQYLDLPDYSQLSLSLQDQDSYGQQAGNEIDQPNQFIGWTLLLVRQVFTVTGDAPPVVTYHTYGAWSLVQPANGSPPIFYPEEDTLWLPYFNPLNFPLHQITLSPWQP